MGYQVAVQMYSLREACEKDFLGTLEAVSALGYKGVEFAGFYDIEAPVLKAHLDHLGLVAVSCHTPLEALEEDIDQVIEYNLTIGNKAIVCPWSQWQDQAGFESLVSVLKEAQVRLKAAGMTLYYHNHQHEFDKVEGHYPLDQLLEALPGMQLELDTCWAEAAGVSAVDYMEKHRDICGLVHIKDGKTVDKDFVLQALGQGSLPIVGILDQVRSMDLPWIIVENDFPKPDGLTNIKESMIFLQNL